jgi:hypothetical protein
MEVVSQLGAEDVRVVFSLLLYREIFLGIVFDLLNIIF